MNCSACGHLNPADSRFCLECGNAFSTSCWQCGTALPLTAKFCNQCGARGGVETPTVRDAPPRAYTPRHLAEQVLTSRSAIEGERKQVTVLFADVKGSLELSQSIDAEEWHSIQDSFLTLLAEGVHRFEGTVNQYTGDGVMALFGAPVAHEDHAQRACYAALYLSEGLRQYADALRLERGLNFSVRMGLNSGEVIVGRIGDDLRMDYTAAGHTVGLASRMEELAEPGKVFLARTTADLVSGLFELRDLGEATVKGISEPVHVHELVGVGPLQTRLDVSRARGFSKFVGRDDDMAALDRALGDAVEGRARVVGISAGPGVGKSRLCFEFLQRCRSRGLRVHEAHALSHAKQVPFLPVLELLRSYFGIVETDDEETQRDKIAGRIVRSTESMTDALPLLFDFLGVPDPEKPVPKMDPEAREQRLFDVMRLIAQTGNEREPTLLLIEDLHWIDSGSERFLLDLVQSLPGTRTLVIFNYRPEYRPPWATRDYCQQINLVPLDPAEIAELLGNLLGDDPSVEALPDLIQEKTAGNPFFIEEIVQSLIEAESLVGSRGSYRLLQPVEELDVPPTVQALLAGRIDRLGEREKHVLQTAAVIGKYFTHSVLAAVAELPSDELALALRWLRVGEFIYEEMLYPESEYSFKHRLTQEVALRSQLMERRSRTHAAVALALQQLHGERADGEAALIARHYEHAGERFQAAQWYRQAAEAAGISHPAEALEHWRRVPALLGDADQSPQGVALGVNAYIQTLLLGLRAGMDEREAKALFKEGKLLASRSEDPRLLGGLIYRYGSARGTQGAVDEALELSVQAARLGVETGDPSLTWAARIGVCHWNFYLGRLREGMQAVREGLEAPPEDLDIGGELLGYRPYVQLHGLAGMYQSHTGLLAEARELLDESLRLANEYAEPEIPVWSRAMLGILACQVGDAQGALASARAALDGAERSGSAFSLVHALWSLALVRVLRREWSAALDASSRGLSVSREKRTVLFVEAQLLTCLAQAQLELGRREAARTTAEEAVAVARRRGLGFQEITALLGLARVRRRCEGNAARGAIEDTLRGAEKRIEETGARTYRGALYEERAELARIAGNGGECQRELRRAQTCFREIGASGHARRLASLA